MLGALPAGTYEIYATVVNNDDPPGTATSATHTFTVAAAIPTTTTLASSANPSTYGQNVTFTATVSPTPTGGTVQFYDGADSLGSPVTVNTSTGEATYSTTTLGAGTHAITADYSGHWRLRGKHHRRPVSQEVGQAPLTVRALNVLRAPNTANPDPFPYQITGYQNGENSRHVGGDRHTGPDHRRGPRVARRELRHHLRPGQPGCVQLQFHAGERHPDRYGGGQYLQRQFLCRSGLAIRRVDHGRTEGQRAGAAGIPAGFGDWYTSGWTNVLVPWGRPRRRLR